MTKDTLPKPASMLERELSQDTLAAIKAIVQEDRVAEPAKTALHIPGRQRPPEATPLKPKKRGLRKRGRSKLTSETAELASDEFPQSVAPVQGTHTIMSRLAGALASRMPDAKTLISMLTPRRLAVAVIIAAILIEPWFIPTVLLLTLFFGTFFALLLGPDRIRHYAELGWKQFERRRPERAAELRLRAMYRFGRLQRRLDKLPTRWTRGLHLPQVQTEAAQSAAESAYAKRMARMAQEQRQQSYS